MNLLESINHIEDFRLLKQSDLSTLADEIRLFLIENISKTGGHIGANLGVVELTIAIHFVYKIGTIDKDCPLLFDVGHQGYTHKLLTGRKKLFPTLNALGGMSRFISPEESIYDLMEASHAGTAIPIACGIAYDLLRTKSNNKSLVVIGDGSLVEGMAFEGLNFAVEHPLPLVIVVNDNGMSIPPNLGSINKLFSGTNWKLKSRAWFEGMGFKYLSVDDGHNFDDLIKALEESKAISGPVVIHVKTEKGKGLSLAKNHPYKMHFSMPFNPENGDGVAAAPVGVTFQGVVGEELKSLMSKNTDIYALTPATPYASGLEEIMREFPGQVLDVGMAEQHAMGMAAGLSMRGKRVFACFQATFMQRALDQIFHDICYPKHDVTIISARSGFAGYDGPTHHAIYDFGFISPLPNLRVFYAGTQRDLRAIIRIRSNIKSNLSKGPLLILHPYELVPDNENDYLPAEETDIEAVEVIQPNGNNLIVSMGNCITTALKLQKLLDDKGQRFSIVNLRWLQPLPVDSLLPILKKSQKIITLEEGRKSGGMGVALNQLVRDHKLSCDVFVSAIEEDYLPAGEKQVLTRLSGIDSDSIFKKVNEYWFEYE